MAEQARRLLGRVVEHVEERDGVVRTIARRYVLITEDFCVKASSARCALALARLRLRVASSLLLLCPARLSEPQGCPSVII